MNSDESKTDSDTNDMSEFREILRDFVALSISDIGTLYGEKKIKFGLIPKVQETRHVLADMGVQSSSTDARSIISGRFSPQDIRSIFQDIIRKSAQYSRIREYLVRSRQSSSTEEEIDALLYHLVYSTSDNHFWKVPPGPVQPFIEAFLVDLFKKPIPWEIKLWLSGLDLGEQVFGSHGITIRTPTEDDLRIERNADEPTFWSKSPPQVIPSAVLETTYRPVGGFPGAGPFGYLTRLLIALKLFRAGIHEVAVFEQPRSLVSYSAHRIVNDKAHQWKGRTLSISELKELEYHVSSLPSLIPGELGRAYLQRTGLSVAYNCYLNSIFNLMLSSERISEAARGLESVYLEMDKKGSKGTRLAKNMSKTLESEGLDWRVVKKHVLDAYNMIRNPSTHGCPMSEGRRDMANRLAAPIIEYLRRSILILIRERKHTFLE